MHTVNRPSIIVPAAALLVTVAACYTLRQPEWPLPPGVKTLPVNGYPMAYLERGSGPTLVLVPGSLNDYRYWMDAATRDAFLALPGRCGQPAALFSRALEWRRHVQP